jgi:hypothetical protein
MDAKTFRERLAKRKVAKAAVECLEKLATVLKCDATPEAVLQAVEKLQDVQPAMTVETAFDFIIGQFAAALKEVPGADSIVGELISAKALVVGALGDVSSVSQAAAEMTGARVSLDIPAFLTPWKCNVCNAENECAAVVCVGCRNPKGTPAPKRVVGDILPPPPPKPAPAAPKPVAFTPPRPVAPLPAPLAAPEPIALPPPPPPPRISFAEAEVTGITLTVTESIRVHGGRGQASVVVHLSDGETGLPEGYEIIWYASQTLTLVENGIDHSLASFTAARSAKPGTAKITVQVVKMEGDQEVVVAQDEKTVQLTNGGNGLVVKTDRTDPLRPMSTVSLAPPTRKRGTLA